MMKRTPLLIGICGASGSGKTTLANHLVKELKKADKSMRVEQFSLDRYYLGVTEKTLAERATHNFDHPDQIDYPLFEKHLQQIRAGIAVDIPNYDYARSCRTGETDRFSACDVLLVDGLHLYYRDSIRELFSFKVFVHTPLEECEQRRVIRDVLERGQSEEIVRSQYKKHVIPMYKEFIEPKQELSDLIIEGTEKVSVNSRAVLEQLAPVLEKIRR
ncbi:MAG: uridine kinase [Coraliomargaritaceae bacterium]